MRPLRELAGADAGAAAVEFTLVLPVFMLMLAGLADGARLISTAMQVHAAAQAGALYAQATGFDTAAIAQAVQAATPLDVSATPAPALVTGCVSGQAIGAKCNGKNPSGRFVTVSAAAPFTPLAGFAGPLWPRTVRAQATVRIQ